MSPAPVPAARPMYWSVRRELWENRSIYLAPLIVAAVVLFATSISIMVSVPRNLRGVSALDHAKLRASVVTPIGMAPAAIMFSTLLVGFFYCLDALYGERRERSILFWKSLPVSDRTTVLAKASIPLVVLPLIAYALSVVAQILLVQLASIVLAGNHVSPAPFWAELRFFQGLVIMFYGLAVHALWFAPIYGWLLLVSAWARRAPVLWAVLPPLLVMAAVDGAMRLKVVAPLLKYRLTGAMTTAFSRGDGNNNHLYELTPGRFLTTPGLWVGLVLAALFLAAAVRLRRNREPI
jgi:ABC-2 type transport system permease protein